MGNTQSQNPNFSSSPGTPSSRRFGSPKPKARAMYGTPPRSLTPRRPEAQAQSHSPRRSSSLRGGSGGRPGGRERERERERERDTFVHRSLRTKKKSLELPDLSSLTTVSIDLPAPAAAAATPTPITQFLAPGVGISSSPPDSRDFGFNAGNGDDDGLGKRPYIVRSTITFPASLIGSKVATSSAVSTSTTTNTITNATPPTSLASTDPLTLAVNPRASEGEATYLVKISWHGGGQEVFLTRAGDDDWNGRRKMDEESTTGGAIAAPVPPESGSNSEVGGTAASDVSSSAPTTFSTIIALPRGTHHLRFFVDGQHRVADDLPTAVDDNGSLANYVAVGLDAVGPAPGSAEGLASASASGSGFGFIQSENQSVSLISETQSVVALEGEPIEGDVDVPTEDDPIKRQESFWSTDDHDQDDHSPSGPNSLSGSPLMPLATLDGTPSNGGKLSTAATKGKAKSKAPYVPKWTQEIPLELLEAAAEEETYLAYQNEVENAHAAGRRIHITGFVPLPNIPPAPKLPRYLEKVILNSVNAAAAPRPSGTASPTSSRGGSPGLSQAGGGSGNMAGIGSSSGYGVNGHGYGVLGERITRDRERDRGHGHSRSPSGSEAREGRRRDREREWRSMGLTTGEREREQGVNGGGDRERDRDSRPLPITTASGTDTDVPTQPQLDPIPPFSGLLNLNSNPNIVPAQDLVTADDTSVLPVPSHVVLGHLGTSAIKDGVLAVGDTVRYRQKFFTTVYYKPTS
ncbi:hypothetical protein BT96DRAFT_1012985 [Gymnopus androsaceus JB14]|uniref:Association with the SNF1 complex (ASC) domain-containing protein n=1 Tax=Gymnopus androsaceus JB14 TaxID=1447944 RepID=A0A6A4IHS6_9AGAR|nr:hypothetical protein BT96DRAFT_1012985 [Gymnopus androsaceus JB14]